ncbi:AarF/UbiB family protein [candidate division CSSED10-310 bacterium]|uniref:AarF/UbiB family protein n=1 Tax=candidate division CSSED10-310 bacterium TaxID=2855610 RepID=A0ABV6YTY1_UNCC1
MAFEPQHFRPRPPDRVDEASHSLISLSRHEIGFRRAPFLENLDQEEIRQIAVVCEIQQFRNGEFIMEEGVRGNGLFIIENGTAHVLKATRWRQQQIIATLKQGDHFGEMSVITNAPTSASVRAIGAVSCLFVSRPNFLQLLDQHPSIGQKLLLAFGRTLSERLVESNRRYARALQVRERGAAFRHFLSLGTLYTRISLSYLWLYLRWKLGFPVSAARISGIHRSHARRFKGVACQLKGANVKMAQLASLQAHLLPVEIIEELRTMRDQVTATEYPAIAGLIQSEFGLGPLDIFADFDKIPLATASMGQVHLARLVSGEKVVVKVLHPGLERSVNIDLWLIRKVFQILAFFSKKVDLMQIYREAEEPLRQELNLLLEGESTEQIGRELAAIGVRVPQVYWHYSTQRVLTLEYLDAVKIDDHNQLRDWGVDRKKLMQSYMDAFLRQALEGGFFHCDPHPANALVMPDGQLALIDFGMVKRLPQVIRQGLMKEILGSFFNNPRLYADGIIERGVVAERERAILESFATEVFSDPQLRSAIFDHDIKHQGDMKALSGRMNELLKKLETFRTPQDELMFLRALGISIDVCREVYPEKPVSQLVMPVALPIFTRFLKENPQYIEIPPNELLEIINKFREFISFSRDRLGSSGQSIMRDGLTLLQGITDRLPLRNFISDWIWPSDSKRQ